MRNPDSRETRLARVERELERKTREMEQFVHSVSHDLRSPLVTITGFLGLVEQSLRDGDREGALRAMERVRRSADRMSEIIEGLLQLSRVASAPHVSVVDVDDALQDLLRTYGKRFEEGGIAVEVAGPLPAIRADRELLTQAFDSLLANALDQGGEDGLQLRIEHRVTDRELQYRFHDNGPGIPSEAQDRVFGIFERLDPQSDRLGVGLAVVDRVLAAHEGQVRLESAPGGGCTFVLAFPIESAVSAGDAGGGTP